MHEDAGALTQLRAWLAQRDLGDNARLPPERELCTILGVSRGDLRKALKVLEDEGLLWRQVGKGTFTGIRPAEETTTISGLAHRSSPAEVMRARLSFEPMLAFEAALNATPEDIAELERCMEAARSATSWRHYETADNRMHRTIAEAAGNAVLLALFDQLNAVRRAVVWSRGRTGSDRPPPDHHSHSEHRRILEAVVARDPQAAQAAMHDHLRSVEAGLLRGQMEAAE
ncbi:FadR family transcriptional regulator [Halovulum dunhuangense]|uniref:FadR family transcriptional regulator n=1 Tax=Halovulum dunhuangense TaxID=1505036 RepID=A0A849L492_9RHOB|nr:FCD domain-containing protein [Halovulum dunhuangense]NNU81083.1 FadR family transcriptional regulator [Halovulum dunhuangense]